MKKTIKRDATLCRNCFHCRVMRNMVFCKFNVWGDKGFKYSYVFDKSVKGKKNLRFGRCNYFSKSEECALDCPNYEAEFEPGRKVWEETGMAWDGGKWEFNHKLKYKPNVNKRYLQ